MLLLVTIALPLATFSFRERQTEASAPPQYQTHQVTRGDVEVTVSAIGGMQPYQSASLSFTIPGRVVEILVSVGQVVTAGEILARQADETLRIAYDQAQLALATAELQLNDVLDGPDEGEITIARANVEAAQSAVAAARNAVSPADLQTAQLALEQAQAALAAAQEARATAPGGQPQQTYDLLDARVGAADFNAQIARLNLERLRTGSPGAVNAAAARVTQAQAALDQLLAGPTQAEVDRAQVAVDRARLELDQAQTAWDRTRIVAPFDGVVSAVGTEVGALVAPGVTVLELTAIDPMHLVVQVDEIDVRQVQVGMPARITLDALPNLEFPAQVESLSLVASNDGGVVSFDVTIRVEQLDPRVRVGMTAEAKIIIAAQPDVLIVPNQYVRLDRTRGGAYVNRLQPDGTLREIPVTLGLQGQDDSQVIAGLREGDVIAIDLAGDDISIFGG